MGMAARTFPVWRPLANFVGPEHWGRPAMTTCLLSAGASRMLLVLPMLLTSDPAFGNYRQLRRPSLQPGLRWGSCSLLGRMARSWRQEHLHTPAPGGPLVCS